MSAGGAGGAGAEPEEHTEEESSVNAVGLVIALLGLVGIALVLLGPLIWRRRQERWVAPVQGRPVVDGVVVRSVPDVPDTSNLKV